MAESLKTFLFQQSEIADSGRGGDFAILVGGRVDGTRTSGEDVRIELGYGYTFFVGSGNGSNIVLLGQVWDRVRDEFLPQYIADHSGKRPFACIASSKTIREQGEQRSQLLTQRSDLLQRYPDDPP